MQPKWTDLADIDVEKIEAHIAQENSPIVIIDIVMNIIDSTRLILPNHPRAGRQDRLKNTRELVIGGVPFIVIYRENISTNCIEVLSFFRRPSHGLQKGLKAKRQAPFY